MGRTQGKRGNGQGSLYREGTYWVAAVTVPGSGGRRIKRRARTEREARRLLAVLVAQAGRGELVPPTRTTLAAWAQAWCAERTVALRASAARALTQCLSPLWRPPATVAPAWAPLARLGPVRLDRLTPHACGLTFQELLRAGAGPRRVQMTYDHLRACLAAAQDRGLLGRGAHPLATLPRPRAPEHARPEWSVAMARRFLAVAAAPETAARYQAAPFLAFLLWTGMRASEGLGLTWGDVTLPDTPGAAPDAGVAWVRHTVVWGGSTTYRVERPKTAAGARAVVLPPPAVALLRARWRALPPAQRQATTRVWTRPTGEPYTPQRLSKTMAALCAAAGVPRVAVHTLRHVHAAVLVAEGLDLQTVRRHLGHARANVTLDRYAYPLRAGTVVAGALVRALAHDAVTVAYSP